MALWVLGLRLGEMSLEGHLGVGTVVENDMLSVIEVVSLGYYWEMMLL